MAQVKTFKVSREKGGPTRECKITVPTFDEMTEAQRRRMVEKGIQSVVIDVQGGLRRDWKQIPAESFNKRAQERFDAILNDTSIGGLKPSFDALELAKLGGLDLKTDGGRKALRAQINLLVAGGAEVRNIPAGV